MLSVQDKRASLKFFPDEQNEFAIVDETVIYLVLNKWGAQGARFVELAFVAEELLKDALAMAYCEEVPKRVSRPFADERDKL